MQLITQTGLVTLVEQNKIIENGDIKNVEGIKYDLRISNMLLSERYPNSIDIEKLDYATREQLCVSPGELVFLLTEEILNLPINFIALIVWKRKMNHEGVMVLGGSAIDPLYNGRLLFGLYNFSSEPFPIMPGRKITSIMLYKLDDNEVDDFVVPEAKVNGFPDDLLRNMARYKPTSQQQVELKLDKLCQDFYHLKECFDDNEKWFREFKINLDKQTEYITARNVQIDRISELLEKEIEERKETEKEIKETVDTKFEKLRDRIEKYSGVTITIKVALVISLALLGAAIIKYLFGS